MILQASEHILSPFLFLVSMDSGRKLFDVQLQVSSQRSSVIAVLIGLASSFMSAYYA